jgi:tape measure domain-containing protein
VSVVANVAINVDSRNAVSKLRQVQQGAQATSQAVDKLNATTAATSDKFKIAANGIKYFTDAAGRARAENGRFLTSTERAAAGIKAQGRAAQQASGKFNGLRNALASLGAGLAVRKAFVDASELESAQARIGLLTKNFSQLTGIQEVAANAAKKFNLSQAESLGTLTDLGNRIGPTGASLQDVANVYEGFNTLLALNKVNTQNAASATLQLNQALGSGRLAGEEFNAISEATPQLLDAVAAVMGRNRSELKQLASDGKISSQVLIEALTRIRTEGAEDLETAFAGAFGATRRFNAALEDFSATIGTELLPALTPLISGATEILRLFGRLPGPVRTLIAAVAGLTAAFVVLAPAISTAIGLLGGLSIATLAAAGPWIALAAGVTAAAVALAGYRSESQKVGGAARGGGAAEVTAASKLLAQKDAQIAGLQGQRQTASGRQRGSIDRNLAVLRRERAQLQSDVTAGAAATPAATAANAMGTPVGATVGGGGGRAAGGGGAKKGNDEANRAAEQMQQQLKAADDINFALKNRLAITQETEAVAKRMVEYDIKQNEIAKEYDELKKAAKGADELALINANQIIEQRIAQIEAERDINELLIQRAALMADTVRQAGMPTVYNELEEQDAALQAVLDKYPAIGAAADAAATLATSGISEMIAGTKSAEQVFVEFLSSIADALINTAKQMIAQYIALGIARMFAMGSSPGGFAPSGPLAAVGDIGTGFNFDAGAMIKPFAEGGFVTGPTNAVIGEGGESEYVIPASKMNAAMSRYGRGARGEGVIAGNGTTSEGGAPAAAGPVAIDVRYSVERINNVEYVTASQFQEGVRQAAQQGAAQGEQRTLRRLQQSPSTRKRVGV